MDIKNQSISYLNKDFSDFKQSLSNFAKVYFPNTYTNFKDADPATLFLEMSSYVGDVLSFYIDTQIQENLILQTREKENILSIAYSLGYPPKMSYASLASVDIYQLIATTSSMSVTIPNYDYGVVVPEYTVLTSTNGTTFLTIDEARFTSGSNFDVIFNDPTSYFLKQSVRAISATIKTATFTFGSPVKFDSVSINDSNIISILSVQDSSNIVWYEVPYLASSKILVRSYIGDSDAPYLLQYQDVSTRFTSRFTDDSTLTLNFGSGVTNLNDTTTNGVNAIFPNMDNILIQNETIPVDYFQGKYSQAKQLFSKQYGIAPSNITLTVKYLVGGGISSNVEANSINQINTSNISFNGSDPYKSITVLNPSASIGGRGGDSVEEIRQNSLNIFQAQNRSVTLEDYASRVLTMPPDFGVVAKAICVQDVITSNINNNPLALSIYVLSYDNEGHLKSSDYSVKDNIANYIDNYRIASDFIIVKDALIINIGVNFDITTTPDASNSDTLTNCILSLQDYFSIDKWKINQPITLSDIYSLLIKQKGVSSVVKVEIVNKQGGIYSQYGYDIIGATKNNVIYPSIDMMIFELKYPDLDLNGRTL